MLLQLPPEVVVRILCFLDLAELASIIQADSTLQAYFKTFPILQYRFATQAAQVEDNPRSTHGSVVTERLALLSSREQGWARLTFDFQRTIPVLHHLDPTGMYDLVGGVYLLGDESRRRLHYCKLPSTPSDPTDWSHIDVDCTFVKVGLNIYEHDLIAVVTTKRHPTQRRCHIFEVLLLQFSTGKPHPLARSPVLFLGESRLSHPSIGIEIVGIHLALVTTHFSNPVQPCDQFYVFEWQTGTLKMEVYAPENTYVSVVFLSPTLLLLPNARTAALDVWAIPAVDTDAPTHPLVTLALPRLAPGCLVRLASRGEPNPTMHSAPASAPAFATAPDEALIILVMRVQLMELGFGQDTDMHRLLMFVRRGDVLRLVRRAREQAGLGVLDEGEEILDNAVSQNQDGQGGDSNANANTNISIDPASLPAPLRPTYHVPWLDWGPPMTRWMTTGGTPTRWITTSAGTRCVLRAKPRREEDSGVDGGEEGDREGLRVLDFNPMVVRRFSACARGVEENGESEVEVEVVTRPSTLVHPAFEEPVESALPYVSFTRRWRGSRDGSVFGLGFEGMLMDEERLVGLRLDPEMYHKITEIEVMHIGT